jgi:hypothetical protein
MSDFRSVQPSGKGFRFFEKYGCDEDRLGSAIALGSQAYLEGEKKNPVRHSQNTSDKSTDGISQAFSGQGPLV